MRREGRHGWFSWAGPCGEGAEGKGSGPPTQARGKQAAPTGLRAAREKVNDFLLFFLLSFLYLLVFKLFQIKFFKPNQNKIK
jgi:hypothetical protein